VNHCQCPKEYTAKGAAKGKRTKKSGQSPYFVGYKKHTLRLWLKIKGKNRLIPLISFIEPANVYEGKLLSPMIQKAQEDLSLPIDVVVGDMGYISADQKRDLRKQWQTAVLTKVRENMSPPEKYLDYGCPECPEGVPLSWDGYSPDQESHRYIPSTDHPACSLCRLQGNCYQEIYIRSDIDEHHFGIIPLHTKVSQRLLREIRPQVERGFENDKNKLHLNRFFTNSLKMARIIGYLSDASQILLLFAAMKTRTKANAKKAMKKLYTQLIFDFE
jgi:hypothetical protein